MKTIALFICGFLCCAASFSQNAGINTTECCSKKSISVSGSAEIEIVPDEIFVNVTLREYDKRSTGKTTLETIKNNFMQLCKEVGIPDSNIAVSGYEGYDRFYWKKRNKTPDLNATITYQIMFKTTAQMDVLVDKLDDEATQSFIIARTSHSNMQAFRKQLKTEAIKAAKNKAIYLTEAIDEKLGEAISINEENENQVTNYANYQSNSQVSMRADMANIPTSAAYKKIKLRSEIRVLFALK